MPKPYSFTVNTLEMLKPNNNSPLLPLYGFLAIQYGPLMAGVFEMCS